MTSLIVLAAFGLGAVLAFWLVWRDNWGAFTILFFLLGMGVAAFFAGGETGIAVLLMAQILSIPALGGVIAGGIAGFFAQRWFGEA